MKNNEKANIILDELKREINLNANMEKYYVKAILLALAKIDEKENFDNE